MSVLFKLFFLISVFSLSAADTKPQRVIALTPALAELFCAVQNDCEKVIVGVTEYTNFPESLKTKPSIGSFFQINLEALIKLNPDLVLMSPDGNSSSQIERIRKLGFKSLLLSMKSLEDIELGIQKIGDSIEQRERATEVRSLFSKKLKELKMKNTGLKVRAAILVGAAPPIAVGSVGFLSEGLKAIGVQNVFDDLSEAYPKVTLESLIRRKPDFVIEIGMDKISTETKGLVGYRYVRILGDRLARPSLRFLDGLSELAAQIHASERSQ